MENILKKTIKELVKSENYFERILALRHKDISLEENRQIFYDLLQDREYVVRVFLARDENTDRAVLHRLSFEHSDYIKELVAQNENTDKETLEKLTKTTNRYVRNVALINLVKRF